MDFYPTEFELDLNGKQMDWEAVVLIPFIDEVKDLVQFFILYRLCCYSSFNVLPEDYCCIKSVALERNVKYFLFSGV